MKKQEFLDIVRSKSKKELTTEELNFFGAIGEAVERAFNENEKTQQASFKAISDKLGSIDDGDTFANIVRKLADEVKQANENAKRNNSLSNIERFKLRAKLEEKKDEIIRARDSGNPWSIDFSAKRAASAAMTTSTILTGAEAHNNVNYVDDLEVLVFQYPKNFVIDAIGGRQVSRVPEYIRWKEQNTESTSALGLTIEGGEKKITDKSFIYRSSTRKKYTGRIEFTEELAMDFDQLLLQVIDMFEAQVIRAWNAGVQAELVAYASEYTTTDFDGKFVKPNVSNVIAAGKLWVQDRNYDPNIIFIRPGDAALARMSQNINGDVTFLPDNIAFAGLTVFESNNVPSGKIIIGTSNTVKEQHSNFILRRGVINEQLITNEETIVGEVFSLLKLPTISKASWVIIDIETVTGSLKENLG
jgi:hypothetical protein